MSAVTGFVLLLAVTPAVASAPFWIPSMWERFIEPRREKKSPEGIIAATIVMLLDECPAEWTGGEFRISHSSGIQVWIANEAYGIHIETKDGAKIKPGKSGRKAVWEAFARWQASEILRCAQIGRGNVVAFPGRAA